LFGVQSVNPAYRKTLLAILARIDQELAEAEQLMVGTIDDNGLLMASALRELLRRMRKWNCCGACGSGTEAQ
jgi:hypothetical protein